MTGWQPLVPPAPDPVAEQRRIDMITNGTFKGGPPNNTDGALIGVREPKENGDA